MALVEEALKQILSDSAAVSSLVGSRVQPGFLDEKSTYPAVAFRKIDAEREPVFADPDDDNAAKNSAPRERFIFYSVAKAPSGTMSPRKVALMVDKAVRQALHGYKDVVIITALSPAEMLEVQGIFFITSSDTFEDRTQTHQCASIYDVHYTEQLPD